MRATKVCERISAAVGAPMKWTERSGSVVSAACHAPRIARYVSYNSNEQSTGVQSGCSVMALAAGYLVPDRLGVGMRAAG